MLSELADVELIGSTQDPRIALQQICELRPDVVILDIHLFGGTSLDMLKMVKRQKWVSFIMMLTSEASDQYRKKCIKAGADWLLYKPNAQQNAKEILQALLDRPDSTKEQ